jgi:hypothetical protein
MHLGRSCHGGRKRQFVLQLASPSRARPLSREPLLLDVAIPIKQHRHDQLTNNFTFKMILKQT